MNETTIQAELPPELMSRARSFVADGWATDFNELLTESLRRFLEFHSVRVTDDFVMNDVQWWLEILEKRAVSPRKNVGSTRLKEKVENSGVFLKSAFISVHLRFKFFSGIRSKNHHSLAMSFENPYTPPAMPGTPASDEISRQLQGIQYPLTLSFKVLALASQATVTDASGRTILYTKQKLFKFREHVEIWTDKSQGTRLAEIKANKVIDWSARYTSTDAWGAEIGSVGRKGWRSIWKAHYETFNPGDSIADFSIREENPWTKVLDSIIGDIPIIGMFSGYFLHPSYLASRSNSGPAMRLTKQPAFWEGRFKIEKLGEMSPREELNLFLSFMMLVMLERRRG